MTALLYAATVLFWGFSWYAMSVQAAFAPPFAAVCHRIGLAAAIMMAGLILARRLRPRAFRDHLVFMGQGVCLFGLNFVLFYASSKFLPSGVMSICFATATVWAALFSRIFFAIPLSARQLLGAAVGVGGLTLLIGGDAAIDGAAAAPGFVLGLCGAAVFALGNMLATTLQRRGVPQIEGVGWGMCYGALGLGAAAWALGEPLTPPMERDYWLALLYLSIFASVLAFTTYLALVARLGAARAAYATVLFPLVALAVSAAVEDFHPTLVTLAGFAGVLLGAALTLRRPTERPADVAPQRVRPL